MIPSAYEVLRLAARWVFDPVDAYAAARGVAGPGPRPVGPLTFDLVGEMVNGQRQDYPEPTRLAVTRNPSGYALFFDEALVPDGASRRLELADGTYVVRLSAAAYQALEREDIDLPQLHPVPGPYSFALEPGYAYPFPRGSTLGAGLGPTLLRGCLRARDGSGIAGAEVTVVGQSNTYRTDATGQWVLVFADTQLSGPVVVRFRLPQPGGGFNTVDVAGVQVDAGQQSGYLQPALSGVVLTQQGAPIAAAAIRVLGQPADEAESGNDGRWEYYFPVGPFPNPVTVEARHPDGTTQTRFNVPVVAGETTLVEPFSF